METSVSPSGKRRPRDWHPSSNTFDGAVIDILTNVTITPAQIEPVPISRQVYTLAGMPSALSSHVASSSRRISSGTSAQESER